MSAPKLICDLALDAHLLARYGPSDGQRPDGRAWERAVSSMLFRPGFSRRQHAGTIGLFGGSSASGAGHEIDGAGAGTDVATWIEAKARSRVEKADVAVFDLKCFDLYRGACIDFPEAIASGSWWPLFVSSEPVSEAVRRVCVDLRIGLCDPERIPLACILRMAGKPSADMYLPESTLADLVRLSEPIVVPMQHRWTIDSERGELKTSIASLSARDVGDLLYLQDELSADIRDLFDVERPGLLETKAAALVSRMTAAALSV